MKSALLALEDGRTFRGRSWAAEGETCGEIVFNTSMTGYQEVLTDPSYAGQIVCMTYPLIGNYGVNSADEESSRPWVEGFVVREASRLASSWRAEENLDSYLKRWNIVAIEGIDTRALVRHIRDKGAMRASMTTIDTDEKSLVEKARNSPPMQNRELASVVTTKHPYTVRAEGEERFHVVCYDFSVKRNSLRQLARLGCRLTVVPASKSAAEVLAMNPDGIFLSNGPGDPASMNKEVEEIRQIIEQIGERTHQRRIANPIKWHGINLSSRSRPTIGLTGCRSPHLPGARASARNHKRRRCRTPTQGCGARSRTQSRAAPAATAPARFRRIR